jgi:hypothetical protein
MRIMAVIIPLKITTGMQFRENGRRDKWKRETLGLALGLLGEITSLYLSSVYCIGVVTTEDEELTVTENLIGD